VRKLLLVLIGLLFAISIPWYRDADVEPSLIFGFPDWVFVSVLCYLGVAVLNAAAWMLTEIPDDDCDDEGSAP
jgi:hypothetical protein